MYRAGLSLGLHPVQRIKGQFAKGPWFDFPEIAKRLPLDAPDWRSSLDLFGHLKSELRENEIPAWTANPISGVSHQSAAEDWWKIKDFDPSVGDIKLIWERSRLTWLVALAQHARTGDLDCFNRLNLWLDDWCLQNPPYKGPNWKCGQETSIRVIHLAVASLVMDQIENPSEAVLGFLKTHLLRIKPTTSYAIAQNNNHGTSEAAALFVGGSWLANAGISDGKAFADVGRALLENRVKRLILSDGSFSQYSLNYHRLLIDTLAIAELWRRKLKLPSFSDRLLQKARAAIVWLQTMVDPRTGDGPNIGANDGAQLFPMTEAGYRDFRPAIQLASVLFRGDSAFPPGPYDQRLEWLGVEPSENLSPAPESLQFDDGGYAVMQTNLATAILRYPRFRFRPSHADALHLDLWLRGENLLRDGGSYSYASDAAFAEYFAGVKSHNTVEFDGHDQMPRLGRFLFGDWLKAHSIQEIVKFDAAESFTAGYTDRFGNSHHRQVTLRQDGLDIVDSLAGPFRTAALRWRLSCGDWQTDSHFVFRDDVKFEIRSPDILKLGIVKGLESRYYFQKQEIDVLHVELKGPTVVETLINWRS